MLFKSCILWWGNANNPNFVGFFLSCWVQKEGQELSGDVNNEGEEAL